MTFTFTRQQHMRHAGLVWLLMGTILTTHGIIWMLADAQTHRFFALILPLAVVLGVVKGVALLSRTAAGAIARICTLTERSPFWQLYSPATYLLVVGMMGFGIVCRWASHHWHLGGAVGILYFVVGIGLISGSRTYWVAQATPCHGA